MTHSFYDRSREFINQLNHTESYLALRHPPRLEEFVEILNRLAMRSGAVQDYEVVHSVFAFSAMALDGDNKPSLLKDFTVEGICERSEDPAKRVKMSWGKYLLKVKRLLGPTETFWGEVSQGVLAHLGSAIAEANAKEEFTFERVWGEALEVYKKADRGTSSCMTGEDSVRWYDENPACSLLVIRKEGEYRGRALVWDTDQGVTCVDRIYPNEGAIVNEVRKWATNQGFKTRQVNSYEDGKYEEAYTVTMKPPTYNGLPFMDTFFWGQITDGGDYLISSERDNESEWADLRYEGGSSSRGMNTEGSDPIADFFGTGNGFVRCCVTNGMYRRNECSEVYASREEMGFVHDDDLESFTFEYEGNYFLTDLGIFVVDIAQMVPRWCMAYDVWDNKSIVAGDDNEWAYNTAIRGWGWTRFKTVPVFLVVGGTLTRVNAIKEGVVAGVRGEINEPAVRDRVFLHTVVGYMSVRAYLASNPRPQGLSEEDCEYIKTLDLDTEGKLTTWVGGLNSECPFNWPVFVQHPDHPIVVEGDFKLALQKGDAGVHRAPWSWQLMDRIFASSPPLPTPRERE